VAQPCHPSSSMVVDDNNPDLVAYANELKKRLREIVISMV
jgi:hypothetical protein